jgi:hypothetical protein
MAAQEPWPGHLLLLPGALPCTPDFCRAVVEQIQAHGDLMASAAGALATIGRVRTYCAHH